MALEDLVRRGVMKLYQNPDLPSTDPVISEVVARLRRKRKRVVDAYGLNGSRDFAAEMRNNPPYLVDLWENDPVFREFLRRDLQYFHAALGAGEFRLCMWTEEGDVVRRVKTDHALIFSNPFLKERSTTKGTQWKVTVQNWDRPTSVTRPQNRHLYANRRAGSSYYSQDFSRNIAGIDRAVFRLGIGIVRGIDRLWLFAKSSSPVGTARTGGETCYIRADVQRVQRGRRPNGKLNGYRSEVHSYPITRAEIQSEYGQVSRELLSRLASNQMR